MIPRIIHYCWFGGRPLPASAQRCIASWRRWLPDCEIREWNEENFDVNAHPYTREAYAAGKYAFVSDFARYQILLEHGGIYFDTDVEVVASLDDLLEKGAFLGIEQGNPVSVNPGLGMAAPPHHPFVSTMCAYYQEQQYLDSEGKPTQGIVVPATTKALAEKGFLRENRHQEVAGVSIYPSEYFDPMDNATGRITRTPNTRTIHRYDRTWSAQSQAYIWLSRFWHRSWCYRLLQQLRK